MKQKMHKQKIKKAIMYSVSMLLYRETAPSAIGGRGFYEHFFKNFSFFNSLLRACISPDLSALPTAHAGYPSAFISES